LEKDISRTKITVLKCFDTKEVFKEPPIKAKYSGPCPIFKEGQTFSVDESMPSDFCPYAWSTLFPFIMTLRFGGNCLEWYEESGVGVACCPDGLRPVVFKLEREVPEVE